MLKKFALAAVLAAAFIGNAAASGTALTVFHDPNCGCCVGWIDHMRASGFKVTAVQTAQMSQVKARLGVPQELDSCHTAVVDGTGQIVEGHVPASAVNKMLAEPKMTGVAAPGMPPNSPGMGPMDGTLVTVDFSGKPFSID